MLPRPLAPHSPPARPVAGCWVVTREPDAGPAVADPSQYRQHLHQANHTGKGTGFCETLTHVIPFHRSRTALGRPGPCPHRLSRGLPAAEGHRARLREACRPGGWLRPFLRRLRREVEGEKILFTPFLPLANWKVTLRWSWSPAQRGDSDASPMDLTFTLSTSSPRPPQPLAMGSPSRKLLPTPLLRVEIFPPSIPF